MPSGGAISKVRPHYSRSCSNPRMMKRPPSSSMPWNCSASVRAGAGSKAWSFSPISRVTAPRRAGSPVDRRYVCMSDWKIPTISSPISKKAFISLRREPPDRYCGGGGGGGRDAEEDAGGGGGGGVYEVEGGGGGGVDERRSVGAYLAAMGMR